MRTTLGSYATASARPARNALVVDVVRLYKLKLLPKSHVGTCTTLSRGLIAGISARQRSSTQPISPTLGSAFGIFTIPLYVSQV